MGVKRIIKALIVKKGATLVRKYVVPAIKRKLKNRR